MDYDTTPPFTTEPPGPEPAAPGSRWPRRIGALAGVAVLAAAAVGFGTAGAQTGDDDETVDDDAPAVVHSGVVSVGPIGSGDMTAFDRCLSEILPDDGFSIAAPPVEPLDEGSEGLEPSPEELEALDAEFEAALEQCESQLSDAERAEMARWDDFESCVDEALGDEMTVLEEIDPGTEPDDAVFDELDARFEAVEAECRDLLPEDLQAEMDAWKDFDECIEGQFDDLGTIVTVDGDDGLTIGSFGDEAGSISVTKGAEGSISVVASGSGTVSDGPDAEGQLFFPDDGACEHLLPEGADA